MTPAQQSDLVDMLIKIIPTVVAIFAALMAYLAKAKSEQNAVAIEVVHQKVNGLNAAALVQVTKAGEAATQAATDIGAAQTKAAHAEGHLEGVLTEQERGIREQVRVEEAKRKDLPPADKGLADAVGKIADVAVSIAGKVLPDPEVKK